MEGIFNVIIFLYITDQPTSVSEYSIKLLRFFVNTIFKESIFSSICSFDRIIEFLIKWGSSTSSVDLASSNSINFKYNSPLFTLMISQSTNIYFKLLILLSQHAFNCLKQIVDDKSSSFLRNSQRPKNFALKVEITPL